MGTTCSTSLGSQRWMVDGCVEVDSSIASATPVVVHTCPARADGRGTKLHAGRLDRTSLHVACHEQGAFASEFVFESLEYGLHAKVPSNVFETCPPRVGDHVAQHCSGQVGQAHLEDDARVSLSAPVGAFQKNKVPVSSRKSTRRSTPFAYVNKHGHLKDDGDDSSSDEPATPSDRSADRKTKMSKGSYTRRGSFTITKELLRKLAT